MARNLVMCLDGTSNRYKRDNTNVLKLFAMLDKSRTDQILYYQPGIGTITPIGVYGRIQRRVLRTLDLAFGVLLRQHVCAAYRFLMQTYQPGDRIYIYGFSRGAYTARVLAGMIHMVGLLAANNDEMVEFAWDLYKRAPQNDAGWKLVNGFRSIFGVTPQPTIELLGLWDTVSSVRYLWRNRTFPYTQDNPSVAHVRHAVALDERRAYFRQNLWSEKAKDLLEVWFPGAHCDVGGGYVIDECGLSNGALDWMCRQSAGLVNPVFFGRQEVEHIADPHCAAHESLKWYWWPAELIPKSYRKKDGNGLYRTHWTIPFGRRRHLNDGMKAHRSVQLRIQSGQLNRKLLPENVTFV